MNVNFKQSGWLTIVIAAIFTIIIVVAPMALQTGRPPTPTRVNTIPSTSTNTNLPTATFTLALTSTTIPTNTLAVILSSSPTSAPATVGPQRPGNLPTATGIPGTSPNILPPDTAVPAAQIPLPTATETPLLSFDSLPSDQGWIYMNGESGIPETDIFSVNGSQLLMDTMGKGFNGFAYKLPIFIDHQQPFTLDVRARVTAYGEQTNENPWGFMIAVIIGSDQFDLGISPGRILGGSGTQSLPSTIDITQFHNYRLKGQAGRNSFDVFVDDDWLGTCVVTPVNAQDDALYFGDGTGGANARADIEGLSFTQGVP